MLGNGHGKGLALAPLGPMDAAGVSLLSILGKALAAFDLHQPGQLPIIDARDLFAAEQHAIVRHASPKGGLQFGGVAACFE